MLVETTPTKGVERANAVMACPNQRVGLVQYNLYAMDVNRGRNCYSCKGFGYLIQNCRRQIIGQVRGMKYEDNCNNR